MTPGLTSLVMLAAVVAGDAEEKPVPMVHTCDYVRRLVERIGLDNAMALAKLHGATPRQLQLARRCLGAGK